MQAFRNSPEYVRGFKDFEWAFEMPKVSPYDYGTPEQIEWSRGYAAAKHEAEAE